MATVVHDYHCVRTANMTEKKMYRLCPWVYVAQQTARKTLFRHCDCLELWDICAHE